MDKTCMSYWYPKIEGVVPTPKTRLLKTDCKLWELLEGTKPNGFGAFLNSLGEEIAKVGRRPCFLRTGHTSGKHEWKHTCYVSDKTLDWHVYSLVEYSHLVDMIGLPTDVWVVREMLQTEPAFVTDAGMPVTKEFRVFVDGGEVLCWHPYWPSEAIEQQCSQMPAGWKCDYEGLIELVDPSKVLGLASAAGNSVGGRWSVDVLWANGWYVIDMAEAEKSWHWPGCSKEHR